MAAMMQAAMSVTRLMPRRPSLEREEPARPLLDEEVDEDQHEDLAQHRASEGLEQLVDDAQSHGGHQRAPDVADAAEEPPP